MKHPKKSKKGFTLVELVVVIAVIAILAAVSVGAYFGVTESAKDSKLTQEATQILNAFRITASNSNTNCELNDKGFYIEDLEISTFEDELNKNGGVEVQVFKSTPRVVNNTYIVLYKEDINVTNLNSNNKEYYTHFEYLTNEVSKKGCSVNILTGETKIKRNNYPYTEEEVPPTSIGQTTDPIGSVFDDSGLTYGYPTEDPIFPYTSSENSSSQSRTLPDCCEEYLVTFDAGAEFVIDNQRVFAGQRVSKPVSPIKEGYTLSYWETEDKLMWDFETYSVYKDMTLFAVWEESSTL